MKCEDMLVLTPADIRNLLTLEACISAVEQAFRLHGEGKAGPPGVLSVHVSDGAFHVKAGTLDLAHHYFAAKVNGNFSGNAARHGLPTIQGVIVLCDAACGSPLAVMDSRDITSLRTAAATAVAAKYLARPDSRALTICGCGNQGRVHLRALALMFKFERVFAYDRDPEQSARFARDLGSELRLTIDPVNQLSEATRKSDICVTCTFSTQPLLGIGDVRPGAFIAAVGADNPHKQEIHPRLMANSKIVCDVTEQCAIMGDLHHALDAGEMTSSRVHAELGEVVAGKKKARESSEEIILFDSTGMALQDVAAAALVYETAKTKGAGLRLSLAA